MSVDYSGDLAYARNALTGTCLLSSNLGWVYVEDMNESTGEVSVRVLGDKEGRTKNVPLNTLSTSPPTLGYINIGGNAFYTTRMPSRQWKQGVRVRYCAFFNRNLESTRVSINELMEEWKRLLEGEYPTLQDAAKTVEKSWEEGRACSVAFHKNFCLCRSRDYKGVAVRHKTMLVGSFKGGELSLKKDYEYLEYKRGIST